MINYARRIKDVKVATLIQEHINGTGNLTKSNHYHVSLRSDGSVDVAAIAAVYGGGGHSTAAGFGIEATLSDLKAEIIHIIVIDKPANISSAKAVATVKRILRADKAGHTGTLDPFATGVLVCCINSATKLARFFLNGNKKYNAVLHLGVQTDTQDSSGKIVASSDRTEFSDQMIHSAIKKFEGTIEQLPPVYSALKHKGIPLYRHARKGNPIQKPPRHVHISYIHSISRLRRTS
jgi:tRNA pseudouridine(55) synthase